MRRAWGIQLVCLLMAGVALTAADWPQYLRAAAQRRLHGSPAGGKMARGRTQESLGETDRPGTCGSDRGGRSADPVPPRRPRRSGRRIRGPRPASHSGTSPTRPVTATISASTKGRERCRSWPAVASIRSAPRDNSMRSISRREGESGVSTRHAGSHVGKGFFGAAGSPLVEDGRVIANIGGTDGDERRASSRSMRTRARCCGPRPATRRATRRRSAPPSAASGSPCS